MAFAPNPNFNWQRFGGNALQDIGVGITQAPTIFGGLAAGAQRNAALQSERDQQLTLEEERKKAAAEKNQTSEWIKANFPQYGNLPPDQAWQAAMGDLQAQRNAANAAPTDPLDTYEGRLSIGQQQGLSGDALTEFSLTGKLPGGNQTVRAGVGQPIFGRNKSTGAIEPWQSMTDGTMVNTANPSANPAEYDFNPGIAAGERTGATVDAKSAGAARAALPGAQQARDLAQRATDALLNDTQGMAEQFGNTLGMPNQKVPFAWPGTPMARFRTNLEQGQGQAFMQARQMLKGGGQITDYEGQKAEAAFSRMVLAAQNNNQAEFTQAVRDFQQAVNEGYQKLEQAAQGGYAAGQPGVTGGQPSGQSTSTGVQWSYEP